MLTTAADKVRTDDNKYPDVLKRNCKKIREKECYVYNKNHRYKCVENQRNYR